MEAEVVGEMVEKIFIAFIVNEMSTLKIEVALLKDFQASIYGWGIFFKSWKFVR